MARNELSNYISAEMFDKDVPPQTPDETRVAEEPVVEENNSNTLPEVPEAIYDFEIEAESRQQYQETNEEGLSEIQQRIIENQQKIGELLEQIDDLDRVVVESGRFGYTTPDGDFRRMVPGEDGAEVVEMAPGYAVLEFRDKSEGAAPDAVDAKAVASFLGLDISELSDEQINAKLAESAESEFVEKERPQGVSARVEYQTDTGETESFYIPLHVIQFDQTTAGFSLNTDPGLSVEFKQRTPIHRDATSSSTLTYGGEVGLSADFVGVTGGAELTRSSIDPEDLSVDDQQYGGKVGFNGSPFIAGRYGERSYDQLNQEDSGFSVTVGTSPLAPVFGSAGFDLGDTEVNLYANQLPVFNMPLVGAWGITASIEGSPSYWTVDPSLRYLDTQDGTDGEHVLTGGVIGWGAVGVPFAAPGPGLFPTRRWELPKDVQEALQVTRASQERLMRIEKVTSEMEQESGGQYRRLSSRVQAANQEYFSVAQVDLVLPHASYAVHLLPVSRLESGNYNSIIANAEEKLGIDIVDDEGKLVRPPEETRDYITKEMTDHLYELNPMLYLVSESSQDVMKEYAEMAVLPQKLPTTAELREMGAESSIRTPHVDSFEVAADPKMEITTDANGRNVIAGQIALHLKIPTNYEEYMHGNRPVSLDYDTVTLYLQRATVINEGRPLEDQLAQFRDNIARGTTQAVNIAYSELSIADNRNQDVEEARQRVIDQLTSGGYKITEDSGQNWKDLIEEVKGTDTSTFAQ